MSAVLPSGRLTTTFSFSKLEKADGWSLESIGRDHTNDAPSITSAVSTTARTVKLRIQRTEPCFITKRSAFTHEGAHWVNPVRKDPKLKEEVERNLKALGIVNESFHLNSVTNITNLDRMMHVALDKYAFFAVTGTLTTLDYLIGLLEMENAKWQEYHDQDIAYTRIFKVLDPSISELKYELVILHPEHFLPNGNDLTVFHRTNGQLDKKSYVVGPDRTLREFPGNGDSARLPPFSFDPRTGDLPLNPFLVILNADIKFRRYLRRTQLRQLAADVTTLIEKTLELIDLIYWRPVATNKARSTAILRDMDVDDVSSTSLSKEENMSELSVRDGEAAGSRAKLRNTVIATQWPDLNGSLEERRDYMQYLLSGRDLPLTADDKEFLEELNPQGP